MSRVCRNSTKEENLKLESFYIMEAIVCTKYGSPDVLELQEIPKPTPKENEVLIKIFASNVTAADTMMRQGVPLYARLFLGLTKPKIPIIGTGFAGLIEEVGSKVTLFKIKDKVFGENGIGFSTNAEYVTLSEDSVINTIPEDLSFEEVVSVCDGPLTSLNFLRKLGNLKEGDEVLVNGASGSLGSAAVQLAKYYGANVTGVCSNKNVDFVKSLGADKIIDYTKTNFLLEDKYYDIIYDSVGKSSFSKCKKVLSENGKYLSPVLSLLLLFQMISTTMMGNKKAIFSATGLKSANELNIMLKELKELILKKKLYTPIDKRYSLAEIADAHRYVETGRKKGNVVILIEHSLETNYTDQ